MGATDEPRKSCSCNADGVFGRPRCHPITNTGIGAFWRAFFHPFLGARLRDRFGFSGLGGLDVALILQSLQDGLELFHLLAEFGPVIPAITYLGLLQVLPSPACQIR